MMGIFGRKEAQDISRYQHPLCSSLFRCSSARWVGKPATGQAYSLKIKGRAMNSECCLQCCLQPIRNTGKNGRSVGLKEAL
jgi:hypothetical protein